MIWAQHERNLTEINICVERERERGKVNEREKERERERGWSDMKRGVILSTGWRATSLRGWGKPHIHQLPRGYPQTALWTFLSCCANTHSKSTVVDNKNDPKHQYLTRDMLNKQKPKPCQAHGGHRRPNGFSPQNQKSVKSKIQNPEILHARLSKFKPRLSIVGKFGRTVNLKLCWAIPTSSFLKFSQMLA